MGRVVWFDDENLMYLLAPRMHAVLSEGLGWYEVYSDIQRWSQEFDWELQLRIWKAVEQWRQQSGW